MGVHTPFLFVHVEVKTECILLVLQSQGFFFFFKLSTLRAKSPYANRTRRKNAGKTPIRFGMY